MTNPAEIKVLVACEESQTVCKAFRERGFEAYSCDIQEPSGGHPEWHILGDALGSMRGGQLTTMDGHKHTVLKWDMVIAHPPCTYLSCAGAERTFRRGNVIIDSNRYLEGVKAAKFLKSFLESDCTMVAVENPVIMRNVFCIRKPDQKIQPYMFGDPWYKTTCLWLKGLPTLQETDRVEPMGYWVQRSGRMAKGYGGGHRSQKIRSKTFPGIAKAMAEQWGDWLMERRQNT